MATTPIALVDLAFFAIADSLLEEIEIRQSHFEMGSVGLPPAPATFTFVRIFIDRLPRFSA